MIEFNTADGEKLTIMHDRVAVKGYPGSDRSVLFIGGNVHALLHSYDEVVAKMDGWIYGSGLSEADRAIFAEENHQTQDAQQVAEPLAPTAEVIAKVVAADAALKEAMATRNADVHDDEGNVGHGAAAAEHVQEAPGAGTEQQPA